MKVDDEKTALVSKGKDMYFYLSPAKHTFSLSYHWKKGSMFTINHNADYIMQKI